MNKNVLLNSFHSCLFCSLGKRKWDQQDHLIVLREMQASDEKQLELRQEERDRHFQIIMEDAQESRLQEADLSWECIQKAAAFSPAFLGTLSQLVQVLSGRCDPVPPRSDWKMLYTLDITLFVTADNSTSLWLFGVSEAFTHLLYRVCCVLHPLFIFALHLNFIYGFSRLECNLASAESHDSLLCISITLLRYANEEQANRFLKTPQFNFVI